MIENAFQSDDIHPVLKLLAESAAPVVTQDGGDNMDPLIGKLVVFREGYDVDGTFLVTRKIETDAVTLYELDSRPWCMVQPHQIEVIAT